MKKTSLISVILYGLCAVAWIIQCVLEITRGTCCDSVPLFCLRLLCAVSGTALFVIQIIQYKKQGKNG